MEKPSISQGAGIVLAVGILLVLIGISMPDTWAIEQLCRGAGVVITFMGMVAMIAARQSVNDA